MTNDGRRWGLTAILAGIALWLLFAAIAALTLLPRLPSNGGQWLALIVFGPPVYVLLEGLGAMLVKPRAGDDAGTRGTSLRRIGLATLAAAIMIGAIVFAAVRANA